MIGSCLVFFFKQKTAYELRISDWSSDVCSSDLRFRRTGKHGPADGGEPRRRRPRDDRQRSEPRRRGRLRGDAWGASGERAGEPRAERRGDRKSVVEGKSVYVRVDLGRRRILKKKNRLRTKRKNQRRKQTN